MSRMIIGVFACLIGGCAAAPATGPASGQTSEQAPRQAPARAPGAAASAAAGDAPLNLGNFSVSLAVKDLSASRAFYEKLGFRVAGGNAAKNWLILQNETSTIGLFQGMFDRNTLTYNPGWDRSTKTLPEFQDVRELQRVLKGRGLTLATVADESTSGPASLMLFDPDGNPILIDQHVPRAPK